MQNVDLEYDTQEEDKYVNNCVGKAKGNRPIERFNQSCGDNNEIDLKEA
jgi:hypothetical protein